MRVLIAAVFLTVVASGAVDAQSDFVRFDGLLNVRVMEIPDQFTLTGEFDDPPPICDVDTSVQNLRAIFDAISEGDVGRLDALLPVADSSARFQWYSMRDPSGRFVTYDAADLRPYFAQRHDAGERIELHVAQLNRWDLNGAHFGPLLLTRSAPDLPEGVHRVTGKAVLDCHTGRLQMMSLSHSRGEPGA